MQRRPFGKTGLEVTPLGFGAAEIGFGKVSQEHCDKLLNALLDAGVNLIDTAACYADSEVKIGKAISHRRDEFVLTTKCGHGQDDVDTPEWSAELVRKSVERSLKRLQTDHLDVVFLHSCDADKLDDNQMIEALSKCRRDGLTRVIGYSGDADAARKAVESGLFDCLETSVNICDQQVLDTYLPAAREAGMGVIAKRPLANVCWRYLNAPNDSSGYVRPYVDRLAAMGFTPADVGFDGPWTDLALRFAAYQPGVHCAITGSTSLDHVLENVRIVEAGPLEKDIIRRIREIWNRQSRPDWIGQV